MAKESRKRTEHCILILLIITIAFIWGNSVLPAETSSEESGIIMELITPFLEKYVGKGNVTMHMVRKIAHFTEYFVLGAELSIYAILNSNLVQAGKKKFQVILPLICGLMVASIDETIQIFASNRGPSVKDVLLDFAGVCTAVLIVNVIIETGEGDDVGDKQI